MTDLATTQRRGPFGDVLGPPRPTEVADVPAVVADVALAQQRWAQVPARERADVLLRLHDTVTARRGEVLDLLQRETGKSRADAYEEVADLCGVARHYARRGPGYLAPQRFRGLVPGLVQTRVERHPHGVVGVIAPWNYPLVLTLGEVLPALLAGNGVVVKPDPLTVDTWRLGRELLTAAGVPAELVQTVEGGREVGEALVEAVDHVVFTGSTAAGRAVAAQAGSRLIGSALELGGKNSMYVRADADLRLATEGAVRGAFANAGQLCLSPERLMVHRNVADQLIERLCTATAAVRLGRGLDYSYDMGSQISTAHCAKVSDHVADARSRGAQVLVGGGVRSDLGPAVHEPTVLAGLSRDAVSYHEETFGPVLSIFVVDGDDEAVELANDTRAGLTASVWSRDRDAARAVARRLHVGSVSINDTYLTVWGSTALPFGGVGDSGLGRRHGPDGVTSLTRTQAVVEQRGAATGLTFAGALTRAPQATRTALDAFLVAARRTGLS